MRVRVRRIWGHNANSLLAAAAAVDQDFSVREHGRAGAEHVVLGFRHDALLAGAGRRIENYFEAKRFSEAQTELALGI